MKNFKDIIIGAIIAVVISLIIVDSDIPSKASNDGGYLLREVLRAVLLLYFRV